ncbi:MAG: glutamate formimidoyltransferase [Bacilli bacterium]|nr:glutamate formimidoyltransferase [Bacilli bacterium]
MNGLIECIPNISEGRDLNIINELASLFKETKGVLLLDYSNDVDHNRSVYTVVGNLGSMEEIMFEFIKRASELIDLNHHQGIHPRMGAVDVCPFVCLDKSLVADAISMSKRLAKNVADKLSIPTYLYEDSCINPCHKNLADLRKGQFEGLSKKQQDLKWAPDFGKGFNKTAGVCAIGVRKPLIAYNVILDSNDLGLAKKIAGIIREKNGGFKSVKALGLMLASINKVQVSMNLCNYQDTGVMEVFNAIKALAKKENVDILYSELIGLMPKEATLDIDFEEIKLKDFDLNKQVIEYRIKSLEEGKNEF